MVQAWLPRETRTEDSARGVQCPQPVEADISAPKARSGVDPILSRLIADWRGQPALARCEYTKLTLSVSNGEAGERDRPV